MTGTTATRSTAARTRTRRRRLLAVLAAAGVLGVGASVTSLASWIEPQSVYGGNGAGAPIGAAAFCFQESLDGTSWSTTTGNGSQLNFSSAAVSLTPSDSVYAWVDLATCAPSRPATVTLSAGSFASGSATLASALTFGVRTGVTLANCTSSSYAGSGTSLVPSGTALLAAAGSTTFALANTGNSGAGTPNTPVGVCFQLSLPASAPLTLQNQSGVPLWTFSATSS